MSLIRLSHITLVRQGQRILADITWHVKENQHWALLGANGSGKTTLLKVITGYEWPTIGSVTVLRQSFGKCNLPELRKEVGWASSAIESRMPTHERAIDIVASGFFASIGLYQEPSEAEWLRAREIIRHVGAEQIMDHPFGLLSQGEQRRIIIARALVNRPQLLVLDEPCAGLDPAARESLLADLERLARSSHAPTIIMVTHHVEEIGPWIDHVLVLKKGAVVAAGPKNDTLTSSVLSEALGCPCEIEKLGDRYRLNLIGGQSCSPT
ncbi:MAG: ABC transporter ATP-binding protein [Phycisphaerae bacterium]